jgi:hypothetical protein
MKREVSDQVSSRIGQFEKNFFLHQKSEQPPIDLKKVGVLIRELEDQNKNQKQLQLEVEKLKGINLYQERELIHLNDDLHNQLEKKETILGEYRNTLKQQRKVIEKKQEEYFGNLFGYLDNLQSKLSDMDQLVDKLNAIETKIENL